MESTSLYPVVCFGEILWDLLPQGKLPGGAPVNVAYHLKRLGKNPAVISRVGKDPSGNELIQSFREKGIESRFIQTDDLHETGKVLVTIRDHHEAEYDIVKPVAWDFIEWQKPFTSLVAAADYFVFGSLVTRNPISRTTLFQCIESAATKVLDINLRPPHFEQKIIKELLGKADVLKLNLAELHLISGWLHEYDTDEEQVKQLQEKFKIETIIVTRGTAGATLCVKGDFYEHPGFVVRVADTVGSGDAFLAAMISKMIDHSGPDEALAFANALGAFVASCPGGCPTYEIQDVLKLMEQ